MGSNDSNPIKEVVKILIKQYINTLFLSNKIIITPSFPSDHAVMEAGPGGTRRDVFSKSRLLALKKHNIGPFQGAKLTTIFIISNSSRGSTPFFHDHRVYEGGIKWDRADPGVALGKEGGQGGTAKDIGAAGRGAARVGDQFEGPDTSSGD
jgi:hypothetical protein